MLDAAITDLICIEGAATYERILEAVRESELEEGILYIKDFLKIYPEFAKAHNDLAVLYYTAGNSLKALAHQEKALKLDPQNRIYRKNLADFYYTELEWIGEAVGIYTDILKDDPLDTEALNALGTINLNLGRKGKARTYFMQSVQIDPCNQEALNALRELPPMQNVPHSNANLLNQSTQIESDTRNEPADTPKLLDASMIMRLPQEQLPSAEELYREAIAKATAGDKDKAISLLNKAIEQDANYALAHNDLGVICQQAGMPQKSRTHHEAAVRLQPDNDTYQKNLADLLCSEFKDYEAALRIYVQLLEQNSYDVDALKALAHICIAVDKNEDARVFLNRALTIKPWDSEANEAIRALDAFTTEKLVS